MESKMPGRLTLALDRRILKIKRSLFHLKQKLTGNKRPSSYPYLSGDSFRSLAQHIHDETNKFNVSDVKTGDIVFVSNDTMLRYLQEVHPLIKNRYILMCHNGDTSIDKNIVDLIDEKIIRLYAQDVVCAHEKIVPVPIGIENLHLYANGITTNYDKIRKKLDRQPAIRKNKIFYRFNTRTNPAEREPAQEYFSRHPIMETVRYRISPILHSKKIIEYKFIVSPPGNAIESCRTWEGLYLKTIPIVKDFVAMQYFTSLGLPMWIVKDWKELDNISEQDIGKRYDTLIKDANWESLHMDFWIKKIHDDQKNGSRLKK